MMIQQEGIAYSNTAKSCIVLKDELDSLLYQSNILKKNTIIIMRDNIVEWKLKDATKFTSGRDNDYELISQNRNST